jgi:transposase
MLFKWRAQDKAGLLSTNTNFGQKVIPAAKYAEALDEIKRLQRLLGKTTSENELLKEAVEIMSSKKWIAR